MLARPIHLVHGDGFQTEIAELSDGGLRVTVTAESGRSWAAEKPTMDEAIALSLRIRRDQSGTDP